VLEQKTITDWVSTITFEDYLRPLRSAAITCYSLACLSMSQIYINPATTYLYSYLLVFLP